MEQRSVDDSDYREHELRTGHIEEGEEEQKYQEGEEEQPYEDEGDEDDFGEEGIPFAKMKEIIIALQLALKQRDIDLLHAKKQNIELLTEMENLSEQYIKEQTNEADQLSKVKQYEVEFSEIQKGRINLP